MPLMSLISLISLVSFVRARGSTRQSGQAIALAAVAMIAIVGAAAFVIDMGFFLEGRRELQDSADSAALAGVIYLPGSQASAQSAADAVVDQNGPIARQLCGHPLSTAAPTTVVTPGRYTPDPANPEQYYFTLTVTLTCHPGFSFGRILSAPGSSEAISASATAVIGGLGSVSCAAPLAAVQFPGTTASTNYGYTPGLKINSFPSPIGLGNDPVLLENDASTYIGSNEFGDFFEVCLTNGACNGAPPIQGWFQGNPCIKLVPGTLNNLSNSPGYTNSAVFQGLSERWCSTGTTPNACLSGNRAVCQQTFSQVVDPTTWSVLPGQLGSPCIMQVAILSYSSVSACASGNCSALDVIGFASMYVGQYSGNSPQSFEGVYVHADTLGDVTFFQDSGTYTIRLIR